MYILATKSPDGEIEDTNVYDNIHELRDAMAKGISYSGKHIGITASKRQFVVFEEWSPTREFEAALDFEVLSTG